jgi:hypothetical protein
MTYKSVKETVTKNCKPSCSKSLYELTLTFLCKLADMCQLLQSSPSWAFLGLLSPFWTSGTLPVTSSVGPIGPFDWGLTYGHLSGPPTLYTHQPSAFQSATCTGHLVTLLMCWACYSFSWTSPWLCLSHPMQDIYLDRS